MALLHPGNISATVQQLRRQLDKPGMPVTATAESAGVFDEELKKRVIVFQTSRGITPDGIVGPHTMIHLNTVVNPPDVPML
jgi:general secretion pathway protein A